MQPAVAKELLPADSTFYPVDDDMGEGLLHREIAEALRLLVQRFLALSAHVARVGGNQFIYLTQGKPEESLAPDVYVLPGVGPDINIDCWKVWETGIVPSFALEVVSKSIKKDYVKAIARYAQLGVPEVVIFDPSPRAGRASSRRVRFQVYRRIKGRGLVRVEVTNEDRVKSKVLGCWLHMVGSGQQVRLRISTGTRGEVLFLSEAEEATQRAEAEAKRAEAEAKRAEAEAKRAEEATARAETEQQAREAERAARLLAEAEVVRLRKVLERTSMKKPRSRT